MTILKNFCDYAMYFAITLVDVCGYYLFDIILAVLNGLSNKKILLHHIVIDFPILTCN
jgi:hypothetical protein